MKSLALAFAVSTAPLSPPPLPWAGGRIFTSSALHVGMRPAAMIAPDELALGFTVQVTVR